jgi:predicted Fe-Mo cluster-binding NifX family protein
MRIAVASDDGVQVAAHTGRCAGFVIFDVSGQDATRGEFRRNTFTAHAQGQCSGGDHAHAAHAHHSHGPLLDALADCRVLVTRGLGPRLITDLANRGIEAYVCQATHADDAAGQYARGQLAKAVGCGCCGHG